MAGRLARTQLHSSPRSSLPLHSRYEGGAPATFGSLYWSFLDVGNTETLMVYGPKSLFTFEQGADIQKTEFNANSAATCGSDYGCSGRYVRFVATNTGMPQPEDPLKLNSVQIASSIQLLLTNVRCQLIRTYGSLPLPLPPL